MQTFGRHRFHTASAVALASCFSVSAGAQEAGTNVSTPPPAQTPIALSGPTAPPGSAATAPASGVTSTEPMIDATTTKTTFPNRPLLITGAVVLGASYGGAAIVGALSDREADKRLYYPVVGPWLDLHARDCDVNGCENETRDKALLIGDGVLQGLGALGMLFSLVVPETTTKSWYLIGNQDIVVVPRMGGVTALGRF